MSSTAGAKRTAAGDDEAGAGGRARKAARKIGEDDEAPPAPAPAGRKPRQLRVKLTGASTCTRQLQVRAPPRTRAAAAESPATFLHNPPLSAPSLSPLHLPSPRRTRRVARRPIPPTLALALITTRTLRAIALPRSYSGHKQGRLVLRPCFGGADECFVICGSEDSQVYIWHRHSAALLLVLPGHAGAVNAVAASPTRCLVASASDDHTLRLWAPP